MKQFIIITNIKCELVCVVAADSAEEAELIGKNISLDMSPKSLDDFTIKSWRIVNKTGAVDVEEDIKHKYAK